MITRSQAVSLKYRDTLQHRTLKNADGTPVRCRVNGECKTWKTRPAEFCLPVKRGLTACFYITDESAEDWEVV